MPVCNLAFMNILASVRSRLGAAEAPAHNHPQMAKRIARLEASLSRIQERLDARLTEIEQGMEEQRELNVRVAQLTDLVTELIAAAAATGDPEFNRILDRYAASL